jgi:hypothetical protein
MAAQNEAQPGGIRKVRGERAGSGKSGGIRVIYFTRNAEGEVVLLTLGARPQTAEWCCPNFAGYRKHKSQSSIGGCR